MLFGLMLILPLFLFIEGVMYTYLTIHCSFNRAQFLQTCLQFDGGELNLLSFSISIKINMIIIRWTIETKIF